MTALASPRTATHARPLIDVRAMTARSMRLSIRDVEAFFTAAMLPVVLMLLFVYVFGGAMDTGTAYVDYVVPGIILLCAGFGAGTTAVSVADDMTNGIIDRFRSMPIWSPALLCGHVAASLARNLVATTLVVLVALLVGWDPTGSPLDWVQAIGLLVLFITAISWLAAAVGLWARSVEAANAFTFVLMFVPYVSSAFVPTATLPGVLRGFAAHQPVTPVIETLRGLWMGTPIGDEAWWAIGWCLTILLSSFAGAAWLFRNRTDA